MKDKKHIDRLFQERFKDFEATPNASVWEAIEDTLQHKKKKKRRVIPIWWRVGGIAAGIMLLITIGNMVFNNDTPNTKVVTTEEKTRSNDSTLNSETSIKSQKNDAQIIASENTTLENNDEIINKKDTKPATYNSKPEVSNQFVNSTNTKETQSTPSIYNKTNVETSVDTKKEVSTRNDAVSSNATLSKVASQESKQDSEKDPVKATNSINASKADALIKETQKNTSGTVVTIDSKNDKVANNALESLIDKETTEKEEEEEKPSILDEIAYANEQEKVADQESSRNNWNVMPNVAPVYFNTLGNGSSIHSQFKNNDKSGQINMSYGIAASYNISNKLSIRSGINKVNVGYNTNDVLIYQGIETVSGGLGRSLETINYNADAESITVVTSANLPYSQVPDVVTNTIDASLDQNLGFIEVPLELAYTVSDKKLGLSVIGGMSALFLSENEVSSTLNGNKTLLGEANNIRNTSFTTNVGFGLDYKISKKIDINLQPVFKYHMNTFKSKSGDFKPYTIGVYTGFSFKF